MNAAVVVEAKLTRSLFVDDVRVLARDALVDVAGSVSEGDVIGPNQAVAAVTNVDASAKIDPMGCEHVRPPFRGPTDDRDVHATR